MNKETYLSTGEAADLLGISRSSVSRKFDLGTLQGKVNPLTGERLIRRSSLIGLMQQHGLHVGAGEGGTKRLLVATVSEQLRASVKGLAAMDERLVVAESGLGSDTLLHCAIEPPDLLILGDTLPDIATGDVIQSLRRRLEGKCCKILCCVHGEAAGQALRNGADDAMTQHEWTVSATLGAKVLDMLDLLPDNSHANRAFEHLRRWPRFDVNLKASVTVFRLGSTRADSVGRAVIRNISEGGAYLAPIEIEAGSFPAEPFRLKLDIDDLALKGVDALCKVVRLLSNGSVTAGVQFVKISQADREKIAALGAKAGVA